MTIIFKITEICNMNCPYCYMFNSEDKTYISKPTMVSEETVNALVINLKKYLSYNSEVINLIFHGGEPLLIGKIKLIKILKKFHNMKNVKLSLQTNGTLIDDDFLKIFEEFNVKISISLDGEEKTQNISKMKNGSNSYPYVINGLKKLETIKEPCFAGVLSVINTEQNPLQTYLHFLELGINRMDFLFPLKNPYNNEKNSELIYFKWLKIILDKYLEDDNNNISIRIFDNIIDLLISSNQSMLNNREPSITNILCIDTDGSIQLNDDLRSCENGYVELELNIHKNNLNDFFKHSKVISLYNASKKLPLKCIECKYLNICGSGEHVYRYTGNGEFNSPSYYCEDIYELISYIDNCIY